MIDPWVGANQEGVPAPPETSARPEEALADNTSNESVSAQTIPPFEGVRFLLVPPRESGRRALTDQVPLLIEGTPVEAEVLMPVPPYCAPIAVAFQIPVERVPTLVKEEERMPDPSVLSERTSVPAIR